LRAGGSAGLIKNGELGYTIAKDRKYLTLFQKTEPGNGFDSDRRLDVAETFIRTFIAPYASCMAAIYAKTANAAYLDQQLANVVDDLQRLLETIDSPETHAAIATSAARDFDAVGRKSYEVALKDLLGQDRDYAAEEIAFVQACTPAVVLLCRPADAGQPWRSADGVRWLVDDAKQSPKTTTNQSEISAQEKAEKVRAGHRKTTIDCLKQRYERKSPRDDKTDKEFFEQLIPTDIFKETEELPYIPIAYSGFMAQLGYYKGAALALHNWIERIKRKPHDKFPLKWYLVRARFVLAGYLEEWIRSQGESTPLSLREYHIENFAEIIEAMSDFTAIDKAKAMGGASSLEIGVLGVTLSGDEGSCDAGKPEQQELQEQYAPLLQSYISALAGYVDHSLKHRVGAKRSANQIAKYKLNHLSLKCLGESVKKEKRAELLEYYARNQLNLIKQTGTLKSAEGLRQQVTDAIKVIQFAIELIDKQQSQEKIERQKNFLLRISSSSVIDRHESLLDTQRQLKDKERELSNE
jgi:hypothetical protein